jgi:hypothetical protein
MPICHISTYTPYKYYENSVIFYIHFIVNKTSIYTNVMPISNGPVVFCLCTSFMGINEHIYYCCKIYSLHQNIQQGSNHSGFHGTVHLFMAFKHLCLLINKKSVNTFLTMCTNILTLQQWDKLSVGVRQPSTSC